MILEPNTKQQENKTKSLRTQLHYKSSQECVREIQVSEEKVWNTSGTTRNT